MGSSFKLIKIIAIGAVILILITLGVFVYKNTDIFIKNSSSKINLSDTNEFNNKWKLYEGKQTGSKLKVLADRLISNAKENKENATMLPDLIYVAVENGESINIRSTVKGREKSNIEGFEKLKEDLNTRHTYWVKFVYSEKTNLISGIIIQYTQKDNLDLVPDET